MGHGPTCVDEVYLPVRASEPADAYATPLIAVVDHQAIDEGLDCLVWDVIKNVW